MHLLRPLLHCTALPVSRPRRLVACRARVHRLDVPKRIFKWLSCFINIACHMAWGFINDIKPFAELCTRRYTHTSSYVEYYCTL